MGGVILILLLEEFKILAAEVPLAVIFEDVPVDNLCFFLSHLFQHSKSLFPHHLNFHLPQFSGLLEHLGFSVVVDHFKGFIAGLGKLCVKHSL